MQAQSAAYETTEARWFKIAVLIVSGFFVGFSIANIVYFNKIRRVGGAAGISKGEATAMVWINALLLAISIVIFLWSIYRLVAGRDYHQALVQYFKDPGTGLINVAPGSTGFPTPTAGFASYNHQQNSGFASYNPQQATVTQTTQTTQTAAPSVNSRLISNPAVPPRGKVTATQPYQS